MRKIIAAMQMTLDGFIEGPSGDLSWVENWEDTYDLMSRVDTCILGATMYPGYEQYWCSILENPKAPLAFTGQLPTQGEIDYANWADRTPHLVLSSSLQQVKWRAARIVRDVREVEELKRQPGRDIHAVGGATLVSTFMDLGLIDELRIDVHPIVLGQGKRLFKDLTQRHALRLLHTAARGGGVVPVAYEVQSRS